MGNSQRMWHWKLKGYNGIVFISIIFSFSPNYKSDLIKKYIINQFIWLSNVCSLYANDLYLFLIISYLTKNVVFFKYSRKMKILKYVSLTWDNFKWVKWTNSFIHIKIHCNMPRKAYMEYFQSLSYSLL